MAGLLAFLTEPNGLTPHGFCLAWEPGLLWLHAASGLIIAASYYVIPLALACFVRRRSDLAFPWVFRLFAVFILACGTTHLLGVITLWLPFYWLDGLAMVVTAGVSLVAAIVVWPLLPRALALPAPSALREANAALEAKIAESEALAARLRDSEARLRVFFEHVPDLLFILGQRPDGALVVEALNPALAGLIGQEATAAQGRPLDSLLPGPEGAAFARRCEACAGAGTPSQFEAVLSGARGETATVESVLVPLTDPATGQLRVLGSLRDLTERRALERRVSQAQKMQTLGQMTGGIAHDFNNILMGISGVIELLASPRPHPRRLELLGQAGRSVERGGRLVRQLLAFSGRQPLRTTCLDVNQVILAMTNDLITPSLGGAISVQLLLEPGLWPLLADQTEFEAGLLNLAVNARDAMPEGGSLVISTANLTLETGPAEGMPPGDYVLLSVADNGEGMPAEVMARAFDPFFTTKGVGVGTGLGLSQVYGFARQSGGTAQIRSAPGLGTTVMLFLPRGRPDSEGERTVTAVAGDAKPAPVTDAGV
ncbi:PAS domain S-box-containing protein [Humitalea rosea]|uniref:histidine kinase n=1 Tax=Humitalea rosea TaxID=990373 RepID=A0A2W7JFY6_9PROT|nr:PAS domain-containing sensor histidine kinase [Humitalea rosea]PZW50983.1 PAS domain S-box-containing protein [Humitalea rosea]